MLADHIVSRRMREIRACDGCNKKALSLQKERKYLKYKEIANNKEINAYLQKGNENLGQLGFTDHSKAHCVQVARQAGKILKRLGYSEHEIELAKIAGYMHDMGNCVNRVDHAHSSAIMAFQILRDLKAPDEDIAVIVSAIGQHDNAVMASSLILAMKKLSTIL